jgi:DedD protein
MDRKLKERLVGAAVLVALGVWLIPWILDGPTPARDTEEEVVATLELPVPEAGQPDALRRETIELEVPPKAAPAAPVTRADSTTPAAAPEREAAAAAPQPEPKTTPPARAVSEPVRAAATPRTAAPAAQGSAEAGWMVQLGSFGDEANARRQADRIKTFGHEARIYPFMAGGRTMYRVRVGSFATRSQAEATASALSAHGFPAQIVAPE